MFPYIIRSGYPADAGVFFEKPSARSGGDGAFSHRYSGASYAGKRGSGDMPVFSGGKAGDSIKGLPISIGN